MMSNKKTRLLFVVNTRSGNNTTDWTVIITEYFKLLPHVLEFYPLSKTVSVQTIQEKISFFLPDLVVAVGGDGTVRLVAESLLDQNIPMGILPAGSANGLAKEIGISDIPSKAFEVLLEGYSKKMHVLRVNGQLCIHLSDIGLNALAVKKFESQTGRGLWGYFKASLKVIRQNPVMHLTIDLDDHQVKLSAEMVVIANATQYGIGAVINPIGKLNDDMFEIIAIKKTSPLEVFKMIFTQAPFNTNKTEIFQTRSVSIRSVKKVHFQVDGEYIGKVNEVNAVLIPDALEIVIPR